MNKVYSRINWENYPSEETPINERNLNKIDVAVDEIDNRIITFDTTKADKLEISEFFTAVAFDEATGVITFTKKNGSTVSFDTKLEKLAVNFSYDPVTERLIITLDDGTVQYVDLSALITQYEFLDSDTIAFTISEGKVTAIVKEGSIQGKHLQPNYLADVTVQASIATQKAQEAVTKAQEAESYAHGGTGTREGEETDNAKYYYNQARNISAGLGGALLPMGTIPFSQLQTQTKQAGYMFNISDPFTTDETFKEGAGHEYPLGTNVYYTADGYWDCLAGVIDRITEEEIDAIMAGGAGI